jgi:DNA-binding transcriptional LysR family regulator
LYGEFENSGIELRRLFSEPRGVALPADHPLAEADRLTLEQFLAEPIVDVPVHDQVWRDFWVATHHRTGPPRIGTTVKSLDGLIEAVAAGLGVAATVEPAVEALGSRAGVVFRPVDGLEPLPFWVAWRQDDHRENVRQFVETISDTLQ